MSLIAMSLGGLRAESCYLSRPSSGSGLQTWSLSIGHGTHFIKYLDTQVPIEKYLQSWQQLLHSLHKTLLKLLHSILLFSYLTLFDHIN